MNDSFFVRSRQAVRNLQGIIESLAGGERSDAQAFAHGLALQQFRDDVRRSVARANIEHRQNIGMIQRGGSERLLFKPAHAVGIKRKPLRQNLDRDFTSKARIAGAINLAHTARP